ncbi:LysR family transcriptional regulator [Jidongwangia harbinensis]|uniref:LysR family transcriptional regulator n=1 Tax=Jidongwangia harbinensis TaxID=2878561 RepID=UPI001CD9B700|nr:LysR family transcriptional regulator [Jidongwangia harbinensis]MCA2218918.1 LysR family transcriptional regulator [Jidongwangia harbinensis]
MALDLNLLTALDALLDERSVTGAAQRLRLSPPAMSRTLSRIRKATGDQILVRTGRTMTPTPHGLAIQAEVHDLVQRAHAALHPEGDLALAALERTFTVRGHDALIAAIAPHLLNRVLQRAPGVSVRLLAEASTDTNDLRHGRVDLEIGSAAPELPEVVGETIGEDHLVAAMRSGHRLAAGTLTVEGFASADHLTVSRRGRLSDPMDDILRERGLRRRVVASAPTSTTGLSVVAGSDLLVAVPGLVCRPMLDRLGLVTRPLPFAVPPVPVIVSWHQRYHSDKAHAWLRTCVREAFGATGTP